MCGEKVPNFWDQFLPVEELSDEEINGIELLPLLSTQKVHKLPSGTSGQEVRLAVGGLIQYRSVFDLFNKYLSNMFGFERIAKTFSQPLRSLNLIKEKGYVLLGMIICLFT